MKFPAALAIAVLAAFTEARFVMYWDRYHKAFPEAGVVRGVTDFSIAFASSTSFNQFPPSSYATFKTVQDIKSLYGQDKKVNIAIGGWADTAGFSIGSETDTSRSLYARGVAKMLQDTNADGVDIDWEFPGGNGEDYKQNTNAEKRDEINQFPLFLAAIRDAIGPDKTLSIDVPGLNRDMIAYNEETGPNIWPSVDYVNIMAFDLMNRRDNITKHHTSVAGSLDAVQAYLDIGLPPEKINLAFGFFAKWFETAEDCTGHALGCPTVLLEYPDGTDTGRSGVVTFQAHPKDSNATMLQSWTTALANGLLDEDEGGEYYFDAERRVFWTWDTPDLIRQKFVDIIQPLNLGGVMAWSLGEDSKDWSHIEAITDELCTCENPC